MADARALPAKNRERTLKSDSKATEIALRGC